MQGDMFKDVQADRSVLLAKRKGLLGESWFNVLGDYFDTPNMQNISKYIAQRRLQTMVYPAPENVFKAFQVTPYEDVKVVIIAQDPYNDGTATGIAMGTDGYQNYPKTIDVLDKAVENSVYDGLRFPPLDPTLMPWATQGILLINSVLTVEHKQANSHSKIGWQYFILRAIEELDKKDFVVYLLWGAEAQRFEKYVKGKNHMVLKAEHPIKHKYEKRPEWIHNDCFNEANRLLDFHNLKKISW